MDDVIVYGMGVHGVYGVCVIGEVTSTAVGTSKQAIITHRAQLLSSLSIERISLYVVVFFIF